MTVLGLPDGFSFLDLLGDYSTVAAWVLPLFVAFACFTLVVKIVRKL